MLLYSESFNLWEFVQDYAFGLIAIPLITIVLAIICMKWKNTAYSIVMIVLGSFAIILSAYILSDILPGIKRPVYRYSIVMGREIIDSYTYDWSNLIIVILAMVAGATVILAGVYTLIKNRKAKPIAIRINNAGSSNKMMPNFCISCGAKFQNNDNFCMRCGQKR